MSMSEILLEFKQYIWAIFLAFLTWVWWSIKQRLVPREEMVALAKRVGAVEDQIQKLPSAEELKTLMEALSGVKTEMRVFNEKHDNFEENLERVGRAVGRIEDFLLRGK